MNEIAISLTGVSKRYVIGKQKDSSLRGTLAGIFAKKHALQEEFWALKDVSFDIQKGDVVGIIGKNGAGKSTLLKILSQITRPTEGRIEINGRIASLLEVGTGFHPELTGRENVFLNGTILGMTRKEVAAKFDEIVAFSGIEKFIDTPVKHYSSGMYVRLAFAVAAHLEPEILIIDEVLAVGDAEFQKKCLGKMKDVAGEGRTVIFVSHDLRAVSNLCNKGVLLSKGTVEKLGDIDEIIKTYVEKGSTNKYLSNSIKLDKTCIKKIELLVDGEIINKPLKSTDILQISVEFNLLKNITPIFLGIALKDVNDLKISTIVVELVESDKIKILKLKGDLFYNGTYKIDVSLFELKGEIHQYLEGVVSFDLIDDKSQLSFYHSSQVGPINLEHSWG